MLVGQHDARHRPQGERLDGPERQRREEVERAQRLQLALGHDGAGVQPAQRALAGEGDGRDGDGDHASAPRIPTSAISSRREHRADRDRDRVAGLGDRERACERLVGRQALHERLAGRVGDGVADAEARRSRRSPRRGRRPARARASGTPMSTRAACRRRREAPAPEQRQRREAADEAARAPRRVQDPDAAGAEPDELDRDDDHEHVEHAVDEPERGEHADRVAQRGRRAGPRAGRARARARGSRRRAPRGATGPGRRASRERERARRAIPRARRRSPPSPTRSRPPRRRRARPTQYAPLPKPWRRLLATASWRGFCARPGSSAICAGCWPLVSAEKAAASTSTRANGPSSAVTSMTAAIATVAAPVSVSSVARRERRSPSSAVNGPASAPGRTRATTASVTAPVPPAR